MMPEWTVILLSAAGSQIEGSGKLESERQESNDMRQYSISGSEILVQLRVASGGPPLQSSALCYSVVFY